MPRSVILSRREILTVGLSALLGGSVAIGVSGCLADLDGPKTPPRPTCTHTCPVHPVHLPENSPDGHRR